MDGTAPSCEALIQRMSPRARVLMSVGPATGAVLGLGIVASLCGVGLALFLLSVILAGFLGAGKSAVLGSAVANAFTLAVFGRVIEPWPSWLWSWRPCFSYAVGSSAGRTGPRGSSSPPTRQRPESERHTQEPRDTWGPQSRQPVARTVQVTECKETIGMPIRVKCPQCGRGVVAKDEYAGRSVKCPGCGQGLRLLAPPAAAPAPEAGAPAAPEGPKESRKAKVSPEAAEERRRLRQLEKEQKDRRNRVIRIISLVGILAGGLLGGLTYPFDLPSAKTGIYCMTAGILIMGVSVVVLFVTPKPRPEPAPRLKRKDAADREA